METPLTPGRSLMLAPIHELLHIDLPAGGQIVGDLSYGQTPGDWAILWIHGFGSHRGGEKAQALEAACSRRHWTFAAFDFRGHGQSSGTMRDLRASGLVADLQAIRKHLAQLGIQRIAPVGSSMGGFAALWFALEAGVEAAPACVCLAPALRFLENRWESLSPDEREHWQSTGALRIQNDWITTEIDYQMVLERDRFRFHDLAARWDRPALILHGLKDHVVSWKTSVAFAERVQAPGVELRLLGDGDHRLTGLKDEIAEETCRFLARHYGNGTTFPQV